MSSRQTKDWFKDDDFAMAQMKLGKFWESVVADHLESFGLKVERSAFEFRDDIKDAGRFAKSWDLRCNGFYIEVKSVCYAFNGLSDFPGQRPFVVPVATYERQPMDVKPLAYVLVSRKTQEMICIWHSTKSHWVTVSKKPHNRDYVVKWYAADKRHWMNIGRLVSFLQLYDGVA